MQRLKGISKKAEYGKGCNKYLDPTMTEAWEIDSSKLDQNMDWSLLITSHLGFPSDLLNIQAKLDKLILYEAGGHYERNVKSENVFGI